MSEFAINLMYYIGIALFGVVMIASPRTFLGRAKFDEESIKTELFIKRIGIGVVIFGIVLIIVSIITK